MKLTFGVATNNFFSGSLSEIKKFTASSRLWFENSRPENLNTLKIYNKVHCKLKEKAVESINNILRLNKISKQKIDVIV